MPKARGSRSHGAGRNIGYPNCQRNLGNYKTQRLAKIAKYCDLKVAVDDLENAKDISMAASSNGSQVGLVVDVNLSGSGSKDDPKLQGMLNRCGVPPGKPGAELAAEISKTYLMFTSKESWAMKEDCQSFQMLKRVIR